MERTCRSLSRWKMWAGRELGEESLLSSQLSAGGVLLTEDAVQADTKCKAAFTATSLWSAADPSTKGTVGGWWEE